MAFKYDLSLSKPLMNAAGTLGFTPELRGPVDLTRFGAFVTNPISLGKRTPARGQRYESFPGGFLLHTGLPNPGLVETINRCQERWARSPLPVIVHLLGEKADELSSMVRLLEALEGVMGIELGLPKEVTARQVRAFVEAASGELPLILRLPMEHAAELAAEAIHRGASAVSLGAPRGVLPARAGNLVQGRLYGPALFPQALAAVRQIALSGLPVIGAGGVYNQAQAEAMLSAGALAVQLDSLLWRGAW
jgi:dihydroorotate dehydrogenase (NAD+) catalytic subunit